MILSFRINKKSEMVFDYLTDMQKFVSVHPVISQIEQTGEDHYLVYETIKLGPVSFSFTYPVTIEKKSPEKSVTIRATVFKLTEIEMNFVLVADGDFTLVEEHLKFHTQLPVKSILSRVFRKQHSQLFKKIELIAMLNT